MRCSFQKIPFEIGDLYIASDEYALRIVAMASNWEYHKQKCDVVEQSSDIIRQTQLQLEEYFALKRTTFELPLFLDKKHMVIGKIH